MGQDNTHMYFLTPVILRRNNIHTVRSSLQLLANMVRCSMLKIGVKSIYIYICKRNKQKIVLSIPKRLHTHTHTFSSVSIHADMHTHTLNAR